MPIFRVLRAERPIIGDIDIGDIDIGDIDIGDIDVGDIDIGDIDIGDIDRHMLKSFKSSLRAAACVWRGLCLSSELRVAVLRAAACV